MRDTYPPSSRLPMDWLVPPEAQPDYLDLPGLDADLDLGSALSDRQVYAGRGDLPALVHHETGATYTYTDVAERTNHLARLLLERGVQPSDRVAVRSPNAPAGIMAAIAVWKIGAVVVPIPYIARSSELQFYFADTEPTAVVLSGADPDRDVVMACATEVGVSTFVAFGPEVEGAVRWDLGVGEPELLHRPAVDPNGVAIVWHTGGTTGRPKGCYHTQRRYLLAGCSIGSALHMRPGERCAAAAPIGHALGMIFHTIFTLLHGATLVLVEQYTKPAVLLEAIAQHEVQTFAAITATWASMLTILDDEGRGAPQPLERGFAMWQSSSAGEIVGRWAGLGVPLLNNYGSTAFATWVLVPKFGEASPQGVLGSPAPGYEVKVVDPDSREDLPAGSTGRLAVRGPSGLTYWRLPEKQHEDVHAGWIYVDDLVRDIGGKIYEYLGRTDFMISSAGNKIAPGEVEAVLGAHPGVREVVVIGLPDPVRQEIVAAYVVPESESLRTDEFRKALQDLVKTQLSPYKYPRVVEYLDTLPRDHVGKVQHQLVKELALQRLAGAPKPTEGETGAAKPAHIPPAR